jgi:hypothetical protein
MTSISRYDGADKPQWQLSASCCTLIPRKVTRWNVALVRVDVGPVGCDDAAFGFNVSVLEDVAGKLTARLPQDAGDSKGGALVIGDDGLAQLVRSAAIAAYRRHVGGDR